MLAAGAGFGVALALAGTSAGAASSVPDAITGGQTLTSGSTLETPDGHYEAVFNDGILSDQMVGGRTLWSVGSSAAGSYAVLQPNGMFVIFAPTGQVVWDSGATGTGCPTVEMQLDGNLAEYDTSQVWTAGSAQHGLVGGDELLPGWSLYPSGAAYRLEMGTNGDLVLENDSGTAIWTTGTSGNAGAYSAFQTDGNLVVYSAAKKALWSSKTSGNPGATLALGTDGNLVITSKAGKELWDSASTGKAGTGKTFNVAPVAASGTPCPGDVTVPTTTVVQTQTQTQTQTVVDTQTVVVPTTTVVTVAVPTPTRRRVDVRMTVNARFTGARTYLEIRIGRLPRGTTLTSTYNPHLRHHRAVVRRATTVRGVHRMIIELRRITYRPGQTLNLDLTRRGYENEWVTLTFRADKLPKVRPVISRR